MIFHILGIIIPTDFHIFQRGWNHQPGMFPSSCVEIITWNGEISCLHIKKTSRSELEVAGDPCRCDHLTSCSSCQMPLPAGSRSNQVIIWLRCVHCLAIDTDRKQDRKTNYLQLVPPSARLNGGDRKLMRSIGYSLLQLIPEKISKALWIFFWPTRSRKLCWGFKGLLFSILMLGGHGPLLRFTTQYVSGAANHQQRITKVNRPTRSAKISGYQISNGCWFLNPHFVFFCHSFQVPSAMPCPRPRDPAAAKCSTLAGDTTVKAIEKLLENLDEKRQVHVGNYGEIMSSLWSR